jgi:elongation factor P--(R)-beta-lysine ligase
MPIDFRLVSALRAGMPDCAGVALGIDRLLMLKLNAKSLNDVLSFNIARA